MGTGMTFFFGWLIGAGAVVVGWLVGEWKQRRDRNIEWDGIPTMARALAADPGSRLTADEWDDALRELHKAGVSVEKARGLIGWWSWAFPKRKPGAVDFLTVLVEQQLWSERTFGPGARTEGLIDHIQKELKEIAADPDDVEEWIDVMILAVDGAWRAGWTPRGIIEGYAAKMTRNIARVWPDWRTAAPGKAIEHVRFPAKPIPPSLRDMTEGQIPTAGSGFGKIGEAVTPGVRRPLATTWKCCGAYHPIEEPCRFCHRVINKSKSQAGS